MTKVFTMLSQMVWKSIGNSMPAFAEMHVRNESVRFWNRYRVMFISVSAISGACAVIFAACNEPFVNVWMHGKFSWPQINNVLLGIWLVLLTQQCCHNSLIICLKQIRGLKYVFLLEGVVFFAAGVVVASRYGMTGMLVCSVLATLAFTWTIGTWRAAQLMDDRLKVLLWDWQVPLFWVFGTMIPCALAVNWLLRGAPDLLRFVVNGAVLGIVGSWVLARHALPVELTAELSAKLPGPARRLVSLLAGTTFRQNAGKAVA
jgi:O-antigen/teichoic acid export membrane protein